MKNIYFLCSPSLGIIDTWLPIIHSIYQKNGKEFTYILIIPRTPDVRKVDFNSVILKIADVIFDKVIFRLDSGLWVESDSIFNSKKHIDSISKQSYFFKSLKFVSRKNLLLNYLFLIYLRIIKIIDKVRYQSIYFEISSIANKKSILFYDFTKSSKAYNSEVIRYLENSKKFSIYHGGPGTTFNKISKKANSSQKFKKNLRVYLFSKKEKDYYINAYGLDDKQFFVSNGVPKYDRFWLDKIDSYYPKLDDEFYNSKQFVLLLSRPSELPLFTSKEREEAIRDIKKVVIDTLGLRLVIKLHPKEESSDIYEKILDKSEYGNSWIFSDKYHMLLGEKSKFVIVFYSGTVIDMIRIGVPSIEYLDISKNEKRLGEHFEYYKIYRNLGFTYGASNYSQLKQLAEKIISNPSSAKDELLQNYLNFFSFKKSHPASKTIADDIINSIN
jgi:hypothetical protein